MGFEDIFNSFFNDKNIFNSNQKYDNKESFLTIKYNYVKPISFFKSFFDNNESLYIYINKKKIFLKEILLKM